MYIWNLKNLKLSSKSKKHWKTWWQIQKYGVLSDSDFAFDCSSLAENSMVSRFWIVLQINWMFWIEHEWWERKEWNMDQKWIKYVQLQITFTAQKMKFSIKDFFSKCDQICSFHFLFSDCISFHKVLKVKKSSSNALNSIYKSIIH